MAAAPQPSRQSSSTDALFPQCRICFDTHEDATTGPLFRPCSCRGSAAWVHLVCLDTWRKTSANPRSLYRCDTCHFEYEYGGTQLVLAALLRNQETGSEIHALSQLFLLFSGIVFVCMCLQHVLAKKLLLPA